MKNDPNDVCEKFDASPLAPNLFIVGASKAGTSALHRYLKFHPQIRMSDEKEPCFFVDREELQEAWPSRAGEPYSYDTDAYLNIFSGGDDLLIRGEASVYYAQAPHRSGVAKRIYAAVPQARIIYLIREPVARTIGHYWQRFKEFQEERPLGKALREDSLYRDTSDYAMQIEPYIKLFGRENVLIVVSEELRFNRRETLSSIISWLGLEPYEYSANEIRDIHVSPETSRQPRMPLFKTVRDSVAWQRLRRHLPEHSIRALRRVAVRKVPKQEDQAIRLWLTEYFKPRIENIERLLGHRIDRWHQD